MAITASVLYDVVHCPQRVALDAFGDPNARDEANAFVKLLWERGTLFERETITKLDQPFLDLSALEPQQRVARTLQAMRDDVPLIYSGRIVADDLVGVPDLLRKETGGYIPGDIKAAAAEEGGSDESDGKPKIHYAAQLGLYIDVLERLGLSAGRRGFIWDIHGNEVFYDFVSPQGPKKPETLWDEYQSALALARGILAKQVIPQAAYASVCKLCHWHTACIAQLTDDDDLTLIPFLGRSLRDAMQSAVATVADLAASNPDGFIDGRKTIFKGLGPERLRLFHARATMLKTTPPKAYLRAPIILREAPLELFFDTEVDPLRDICYLHGVVERHGRKNDSEQFRYFFAPEVTPEAEREAFAAAYAYLSGHSEAVIYIYSKYERTQYRKLQAKYSDVCRPEDIERLFEPNRTVDLYGDVVIKATEWPTLDHSIKTLAKYLGFTWRDRHPSGAAAVEWFDRWCREGKPEIKQRILEYNEDDCRATRFLLDGIRALAS